MDSRQQISRYKTLCSHNKKALQNLFGYLDSNRDTFSHEFFNYGQVKQQYQIILAASKDSIEFNSQLQMELQQRYDVLNKLKSTLYKQNRQLEGLSNEVTKVADNLKRQRSSRRDLLKSEDDLSKMRRDIERLRRKRVELVRQQKQLEYKQHQSKGHLVHLDEQIREIEYRNENQRSSALQKVLELQRQIKDRKDDLNSMKQITSRVVPSDPNGELRRGLAQMQVRIRESRERTH